MHSCAELYFVVKGRASLRTYEEPLGSIHAFCSVVTHVQHLKLPKDAASEKALPLQNAEPETGDFYLSNLLNYVELLGVFPFCCNLTKVNK